MDKGIQERTVCPAGDCQKPEEAAEQAVKKVFAIFGVDVGVPREVEKFRAGIRFGEEIHKYAKYGMFVVVGVFAAATAGAVIIGALEKIRVYVLPPGPGS